MSGERVCDSTKSDIGTKFRENTEVRASPDSALCADTWPDCRSNQPMEVCHKPSAFRDGGFRVSPCFGWGRWANRNNRLRVRFGFVRGGDFGGIGSDSMACGEGEGRGQSRRSWR
jgi:hypothetical protein